MTPSHGTVSTTEPALADKVCDLLADSPAPVLLSDLLKKFKPSKVKGKKGQPAPAPVDPEPEVRQALEDAHRAGRVFRHPSGPQGAERYWGRDEKEAIRGAAVEAAAAPRTLAQLRTAAGKAVNGAAAGFVDGTVRDLIGEDVLFEHPAKTKAGGPLFAAFAPPPPPPALEQPKFKKKLDTLFNSFDKLRADAGVPADELFAALRARLGAEEPESRPGPTATAGLKLEELILRAVANAGPGSVLSLAELRRQMPVQYRDAAFGEAVLRLARENRVSVYQDGDPAALSTQERAEYVDDGRGHVFKTIARNG